MTSVGVLLSWASRDDARLAKPSKLSGSHGLFDNFHVERGCDRRMVKELGRRVFEPRTGDERLDALRLVLSSREPAKIDGVFVEHHWARMILEVYDELDPKAQSRLAETQMSRIPDLIDEWAKGRERNPPAAADSGTTGP